MATSEGNAAPKTPSEGYFDSQKSNWKWKVQTLTSGHIKLGLPGLLHKEEYSLH